MTTFSALSAAGSPCSFSDRAEMKTMFLHLLDKANVGERLYDSSMKLQLKIKRCVERKTTYQMN